MWFCMFSGVNFNLIKSDSDIRFRGTWVLGVLELQLYCRLINFNPDSLNGKKFSPINQPAFFNHIKM